MRSLLFILAALISTCAFSEEKVVNRPSSSGLQKRLNENLEAEKKCRTNFAPREKFLKFVQ
ncbi:MAG: plasmid partition protein ParG [Bacteriovorax sp.]